MAVDLGFSPPHIEACVCHHHYMLNFKQNVS